MSNNLYFFRFLEGSHKAVPWGSRPICELEKGTRSSRNSFSRIVLETQSLPPRSSNPERHKSRSPCSAECLIWCPADSWLNQEAASNPPNGCRLCSPPTQASAHSFSFTRDWKGHPWKVFWNLILEKKNFFLILKINYPISPALTGNWNLPLGFFHCLQCYWSFGASVWQVTPLNLRYLINGQHVCVKVKRQSELGGEDHPEVTEEWGSRMLCWRGVAFLC